MGSINKSSCNVTRKRRGCRDVTRPPPPGKKLNPATARATDLLPVIAEVRAAGGYAERARQGVDGARRADTEPPRRLESGDGDAAGSPGAGRLNVPPHALVSGARRAC